MSDFRFIKWDELDAESRNELSTSPLLQKLNNHYLRNTCSQEYFIEYLGENHRNRSIILFQNETPILALTRLCRANEINFAGQPSEIITIADKALTRSATIALINYLKKEYAHGCVDGLLSDNSLIIKELVGNITAVHHHYHGFVDLDLSESEYRKHIRKSYKSLINWGEKNLEIRLVHDQEIDFNEFKAFQSLHFEASGRATRSEASWLKQYDMISEGHGFLLNAYFDGEIVSGCFIMKDNSKAFYGVAAGRRDLMADKLPINHFPLYVAINHCRQSGLKEFIFGNVDTDHLEDSKLNNINQFKRGFCTNLTISHSIRIQIGNSQNDSDK